MADERTTTQAPASGAPRPLAIDEGHILRAQRGDRIATAVLLWSLGLLLMGMSLIFILIIHMVGKKGAKSRG